MASLITFAKENNIDKAKELLQHTPDSINATDNDGLSPLHWTARNGHLDFTRFIVSVPGVNIHLNLNCYINHVDQILHINLQSHSGFTPLYEAALKQHYEIVKVLLEADANVNLQDAHGRSVLHIACENGDEKAAILCLELSKQVNVNLKGILSLSLIVYKI